MARLSNPEKNLEYVKATMALEGLQLPNDTLGVYKKFLNKEYTSKEARNIILKKHSLKRV